jgi:hypothetical protein
LLKPGSATSILLKERGFTMATTTIIQIVAGVLAVVLLIALIARRARKNK